MTRWYSLEPVDGAFFTAAPHVFRYERRFAAAPETVWESLVSDESLSAWSPLVSSVTWLSPRPFGVGTTREVTLAPGLTHMRERFFRWDEGRGYSFAAFEGNQPLLKSFAEDYEVEADGDGSRLTWTVAIEPKRALALAFIPLAPVLKLLFGRVVVDGERYFARA